MTESVASTQPVAPPPRRALARPPMPRPGSFGAWVCLLAMLAAVPAEAAQTPAVRSTAVVPQVVQPGKKVAFTVQATGATAFHLSTDKRWDRSDPRLGSRTLKGKKVTLKLAVPRSAPLGAYHLLACSQPVKKGGRPKCRVSKDRVAVPAKPKPASVAPQPDAERATTAQIERTGGSVSATGSDGTVYTLTVPEGALLDPTTITLTPVASAAGLPKGFTAARAVQIEPTGRQLLRPATLTIAGQGLPHSSNLAGFGFQSGGKQFHLSPASTSGEETTLQIFELEGHGVASASPKTREAFARTRLPTDLIEQLEQLVAVSSAREKPKLAAAQSKAEDDLAGLVLANHIQIRTSALVGQIDLAVPAFVAWEGLVGALHPSLRPFVPALRASLVEAFSSGFRREIAVATVACVSGDIRQMGRLLRYRDYLMTSLLSLSLDLMRTEIDAALDRCLRFELAYEVAINGENSYREGVSANVTSEVPVRMLTPGQPSTFFGFADLVVGSYSVGPADCWAHTWDVKPKEPFFVNQMAIDLVRQPGLESQPPRIRVRFRLGSLDEQVTHTCDGDASTSYTDTQHAYDGVVAALLGGKSGSEFELSWGGLGSTENEYSSQSFTRTSEGEGSYTGTLTFRLRHRPG